MTPSYRTSIAGYAAIAASLLGLLSHVTGLPPWLVSILGGLGGVSGGIGLLLARDNAVSDEQAGAGQVPR